MLDSKGRPVEGSIWEKDDELFIVERVYDAHQSGQGTLEPITLVKHRCIDPMPNHSRMDRFLELYKPYVLDEEGELKSVS